MSILGELQSGYEAGIREAEHLNGAAPVFRCAERHFFYGENPLNQLALGDNVEYMRWLLEQGYAGKIRLIYIDPPFFTKSKFDAAITIRGSDGKRHPIHHLAYDDTFERSLEHYSENMTLRLLLMRELLAEDGLIWVHLDWHSSHYIRILMDEIFGTKNFVNEIIWKYKSGGSGKRHFSRKHDTLLVYSKTNQYYLYIPEEKSYNRGRKPYHFKGIQEYRDDYGWYTMVNMKDVWSIDMVGRTSGERVGYATQKPIALMQRIIESSTAEGELCADFFCGSGSLLAAAQNTGRRWLGCDNTELAISMTRRRMEELHAGFELLRREEQWMDGKVSIRCTGEDELENGKKLFTLCIDDFRPDIDYGYIPLRDRDLVRRIETEDPVRLIDYVMIDPKYEGRFCSEIFVDGASEPFRFQSHGRYACIIVDVFGKEYFADGEKISWQMK